MAGNKMRNRRKINKGKGKRWLKGCSSSSNPQNRTFREKAKRNRFSCVNTGSITLTEAAIAQHNAKQINDGSDLSDDEVKTLGGKTFQSFVTNLSDCSNPSFNRLIKSWQTNSASQKEMLAVLAAVAEVIKSKGGKESDTEYFAALMTTLESVDGDEARAATVSLLGMVMKRVPPAVLKSRFSDISKTLVKILELSVSSGQNALLRGLIGCLSILLRVQEEAVWSNASTLHIYNAVLAFVMHGKPKVRKSAQHAVCAILKGSAFMTQILLLPHHPAASATAKFCIRKMEESGGTGPSSTTTLHILGLLKEILSVFPRASLKSVCETILRVMTLSNALVTSCSLQSFHGMFLGKPNSENLPAEMNAQLITALYDFQPSLNDAQATVAWIAVMQQAFLHLHSLDQKLCANHLAKFFGVAVQCWLSDKAELCATVSDTMKILLSECVRTSSKTPSDVTSAQNPFAKLFAFIENGLTYQYHSVWGHVLNILGILFEVLGKQYHSLFAKCLESMANLRESHRFGFTSEVDRAVGMAVRVLGPELVLQAVPLQIDSVRQTDFSRSWLIPVIRDNVRDTKLDFFSKYFLPLANSFKASVKELELQNKIIEAKTFDVLHSQIWSMLPGFCNKPTDLSESFQGVARTLGLLLTERAELRLNILSALRNLISKNLDNATNRSELAKYAKNYLPILFNLYTTETKGNVDEGVRLAVYETIKVYLQITDEQLCASLFEKAMSKLQSDDLRSFSRYALLDLTRALMFHLDEKNVGTLYLFCKKFLKDTDKKMQKKTYRVLEELCRSGAGSSKAFVDQNLLELQELLISSLSASTASARAPRLRCLCHIIQKLDPSNKNFILTLVPEAVLCVKENAEKARSAAYNLLAEIGYTLQRWSDSSQEALQEYLKLILPGFTGTPHMISCTILAIGRILFTFRSYLSSNMIDLLIENICLLFTAHSREIIQSSLSFIKILFSVLDTTVLVKHVPQLIDSLVNLTEDCQRHFRFKIKEIFVRFVRKFGYETIAKMVPESHRKVLTNIRKMESRKSRLKREKDAESSDDEFKLSFRTKSQSIEEILQDSESELEENEIGSRKNGDKKESRAAKKAKTAAWIQEGTEDSFVDFLDSSVSKKVMAVRPKLSKGQKSKQPFQTASDGRLIIIEADNMAASDDSDENISDLMDTLELRSGLAKTKKRKLEVDDEDNRSGKMAKHTSAGHGIYRKVSPNEKEFGCEYRLKKAGGDVKKKGKLEPYAYIQLNRQSLNKRKRKGLSKELSGFVRKAKQGAKKGMKSKSKRRT